MQQIIGVTELQRKFRSFFEQVVSKRTPIILTRGSRPEAVLISYVEAALAAEADCIVSGDADLLTLTPFENIPILRPAELLARV